MLGLTAQEIEAGGAHWTAREIAQQPQLWPEVAQRVAADAELTEFLRPLLGDPQLRVVLTGAGSSSFIGECLAPSLARIGARRVAAIATTDMISCPDSCLLAATPTLLVHFARSGNSPESVAALELAEQRVKRCAHLIVTCNAAGDLYRRAATMGNAHTVLLPEASNDQSFAMTSSFTGMLLAAAAALRVLPAEDTRIGGIARLSAHVMHACLPVLSGLVHAGFERVVYLGSNELKGLAREAALKMLELTNGGVVSIADSPLGFRHGPKTILNGNTLVVVFLGNDSHARRYDLDLVTELRRDAVARRVIALASRADGAQHPDTVVLGDEALALTDLELCLPYAVFAQALAMLQSLSLGLSPDNPNAAGTVNRVVQGVTIYRYGDTQ
jgi:tagatose-6-phosphate ketose/aldose isomerase